MGLTERNFARDVLEHAGSFALEDALSRGNIVGSHWREDSCLSKSWNEGDMFSIPLTGTTTYGLPCNETHLVESNEEAIRGMLDGAGVDYVYNSCDISAVVIDEDGNLLPDAVALAVEILESLANYPLLDDEDYRRREWECADESANEALEEALKDLAKSDDDVYARIMDPVYGWMQDDVLEALQAREDHHCAYDVVECWHHYDSAALADTVRAAFPRRDEDGEILPDPCPDTLPLPFDA